MQGYTNPSYSSTGVSYGETDGNEFIGFANLALDGNQTYDLGSNTVLMLGMIRNQLNLVLPSLEVLLDYASWKSVNRLTNNGTISGNITFSSE